MEDSRYATVAWARWLLEHRASCTYSQGPERYANLNRRGLLPYVGDCSSTVRNYYNWAGAPDPYELGYSVPEGYTGTELSAGTHIPFITRGASGINRVNVLPGDAVVYGPGTGWHTALVVEIVGSNVLTISMGEQGDPSYVWANRPTCPDRGYGYDGREPQTWLRFPTRTRRVYWPEGVHPFPTRTQVRQAGLYRVDAIQAQLARDRGWTVYGWDGSWFMPEGRGVLVCNGMWASPKYETVRVA